MDIDEFQQHTTPEGLTIILEGELLEHLGRVQLIEFKKWHAGDAVYEYSGQRGYPITDVTTYINSLPTPLKIKGRPE